MLSYSCSWVDWDIKNGHTNVTDAESLGHLTIATTAEHEEDIWDWVSKTEDKPKSDS
jgi:hypothetical protein